jgi:hypothetical protein
VIVTCVRGFIPQPTDERERSHWSMTSVVRSRGLEPPRDFSHKHLKLARLPFRHDRIVV